MSDIKVSEMAEATTLNDNDLLMVVQNGVNKKVKTEKIETEILKLVFPVGSTYITQEDTNPNGILGFGTWERLKGKVCLGLDEEDTDFDTIGKTGGEKTHKHLQTMIFSSNYANNSGARYASGESMATDPIYTKEASNVMPYTVVGYMWIRRA